MSDASLLVVRRTFVEIFEPEDENRRGGSCPPNISRDKVGTRMAAEALLGVCHKICIRLCAPQARPRSECEHSHSDRGRALGSNH